MGGSTYSRQVFDNTVAPAAAAGTAFAYTTSVKTGAVAAKVHDLLDPKQVAGPNSPFAGKIVRESCDSDAHPNSRAVAILLDQTGSMDVVPRTLVSKLGKLMSILVSKGYLADPHLLFGGIGDATGMEVAPLQVGQFEAGNEIDGALTHIYLEGNGGGQMHESYELALWFLAEYAEMDCLKKRGQKGYLFIVGDELPYPMVRAEQIKRLVGVDIGDDILLDTVLEKVQEKFELFWIMPSGTMYWGNSSVEGPQKKRFGERFIKLENVDEVAEFIAATIGTFEGFDNKSIVKDLVDGGLDPAAAKRATALSTQVSGGVLVKKAATLSGTLAVGKDSVSRL